jgi:hypothetical protein
MQDYWTQKQREDSGGYCKIWWQKAPFGFKLPLWENCAYSQACPCP